MQHPGPVDRFQTKSSIVPFWLEIVSSLPWSSFHPAGKSGFTEPEKRIELNNLNREITRLGGHFPPGTIGWKWKSMGWTQSLFLPGMAN